MGILDKDYGLIWVCQDCMLHHANGECGSCHHPEGHDKEPLSSIGDGFTITMGMLSEEHLDECTDATRGECDCDINTYSTSQCEGCGSWLHGERHAFHLWKVRDAA
jgi:hypothetical protein